MVSPALFSVCSVWLLLLLVLSGSAAQTAPSAGDPKRVLERVDSLLHNDPANPQLLTVRGAALETLGRRSEALQSFEKALAISPKYLAALEGAADITYQMHSARATNFLARILELDKSNVPAHAMSGALAFESHNCAAASNHFQAAAEMVRTDSVALAQWGECLVVPESARCRHPTPSGISRIARR